MGKKDYSTNSIETRTSLLGKLKLDLYLISRIKQIFQESNDKGSKCENKILKETGKYFLKKLKERINYKENMNKSDYIKTFQNFYTKYQWNVTLCQMGFFWLSWNCWQIQSWWERMLSTPWSKTKLSLAVGASHLPSRLTENH